MAIGKRRRSAVAVAALTALLATGISAQAAETEIAVSPGEVTSTQEFGAKSTATFTITNNGSAAKQVRLAETGGDFVMQDVPAKDGGDGDDEKGAEKLFVPHKDDGGRLGARTSGAQAPQQSAPADAGTMAGPWTDVTAFPVPVMDNLVANHNGKIYSVAGTSNNKLLQSVHVYDPATSAWTTTAPLKQQRQKPNGAFVDGKLYVAGGWLYSGMAADLEIFDPGTGNWSLGAPTPVPLAASGTAVVDGKMYLVGGCDDATCGKTTVQSYDPKTDTWEVKAPYPLPVSWSSCGEINDKLYCAGGISNADGATATAHEYDPATDSWIALPDMPTALWGSGYTATAGQLAISGGSTGAGVTNIGYAYDVERRTWEALPNSNHATYRGGSTCGLYRIGGAPGAGFIGSTTGELLPGYDACGADVAWLSVDEDRFALEPGQKRTVTVTMDGAAVTQPGTYNATLKIGTNAADVVDPVTVKMTVTAPRKWGKISGVVTSAACSGAADPLEGATVVLSSGTVSQTVTTGKDGVYQLWLDKQHSPVTVLVTKDDWRSDSAVVKIKKGVDITKSFGLDPYPFCSGS